MTAVLLIYFILTSAHRWEFLTMGAGSRARCEMSAFLADQAYKSQPGNVRIICVDDERVAI